MVNIEVSHSHKEFGALEQGALFTVLAEVKHPLYVKTEVFNINSAADLAVNAVDLGTGKGYYMKSVILISDYNALIMASGAGA